MVKRIFATVLCCLSAIAIASAATPKNCQADQDKFIIGAYLNLNWVKSGYDFERIKYVDRIYCFGMVPDAEGNFVVSEKYLAALKQLKDAVQPGQQILLTIGGGAETSVKNMHTMGSDPAKRKAYAKALVKFARANSFDGIDVDWEGSGPLKITVDTDDLRDFLSLVRKGQKKGQLLTASLSRRKECGVQAAAISNLVDDISVMIYSRIEREDRSLAPLWAVQKALGYYTDNDVPNGILLPGVPFYGIHQSNADGKKRINLVYNKIEPTLPQGDSKINVNPDGFAFNSYSDMREKAEWIKARGYKGIMIWEISQDTSYDCERSLLRAINDAVKQ